MSGGGTVESVTESVMERVVESVMERIEGGR